MPTRQGLGRILLWSLLLLSQGVTPWKGSFCLRGEVLHPGTCGAISSAGAEH